MPESYRKFHGTCFRHAIIYWLQFRPQFTTNTQVNRGISPQRVRNFGLAVGALSYAGEFNIMAVADRDICPDLDTFVTSARNELEALSATCASRSRLAVG
jgi:hypothetical protein